MRWRGRGRPRSTEEGRFSAKRGKKEGEGRGSSGNSEGNASRPNQKESLLRCRSGKKKGRKKKVVATK